MAEGMTAGPSSGISRRDRMLKTFEGYRTHFDDVITQLSKKLIFHLHRASLIPQRSEDAMDIEYGSVQAGEPSQRERLLSEAESKLDEIKEWLGKVRDELEMGKTNYWQFGRNMSIRRWLTHSLGSSPGMQEFIESISFLYYLRSQSLISPEELASSLVDKEGRNILDIPAEDYALGISDLSGELMRYATNCSGSGNHSTALHACGFVRDMKAGLDASQPFVRELGKKQQVTGQSLEKIERVCYAIQLRILEYGDRPEVLARFAKRALEESQEDADGAGPAEDVNREGGGHASRDGASSRGRGRGRGRGGMHADGPPRKRTQTES